METEHPSSNLLETNLEATGNKKSRFSRATSVMLIVGTILVAVSASQWLINNYFTARELEQRSESHLATAVNIAQLKIENIMEDSAQDIDIIKAHKAIENYFTASYFDDIDEMTSSVSSLEVFFKQVNKAKPRYTKIQLSSLRDGGVLQLNHGVRVESFDRFPEIIGTDSFQRVSQFFNRDDGTPTLFYESYFDEQDGWIVITVCPIAHQGVTEGFLWLCQPVRDLFPKIFLELQKAEIVCVIINNNEEIITKSPSLDKVLLTDLLSEKSASWLATKIDFPLLGWKIKVGMPRTLLHAQQKKFQAFGLVSLFVSLGLAMTALWGLKIHQSKLEKKIEQNRKIILDKNSALEKALAELSQTQEQLILKKNEIEKDRLKIQEALDGIFSLIQRVSEEKHFGVKFVHPNLKKCWDFTNCDSPDCMCYGKEPMRCWQVVGQYSAEPDAKARCMQEGNKCQDCSFYKEVTYDPIFQIGEQFNNMMHILETQNLKLENAYSDLKNTQAQLLQREKMASLGQLAAGVAHEINNPMGFITSNLGSLRKYVDKFIGHISSQAEILASLDAEDKVEELRKKDKIDFMIEDSKELLDESLDGARRVVEIVQNLKGFARLDEAGTKEADINECLDVTLKIIGNELKYKCTVHKDYGELPMTLCNAQELNQVFMNILVNAAQSIEKQGDISIRTWAKDELINVSIADTGSGIPQDKIDKIFDPFFTTKEVGKGTGLGLSICYDIVKRHDGELTVESEINRGTTFRLSLPVKKA